MCLSIHDLVTLLYTVLYLSLLCSNTAKIVPYHCYVFNKLLFSLSVVSDPAIPWTAARQASLSFTISQILVKLMSIDSVILSNHLILSPASPPALSFQESGFFHWVGSSQYVAKVLEFQLQHQSFQLLPMTQHLQIVFKIRIPFFRKAQVWGILKNILAT